MKKSPKVPAKKVNFYQKAEILKLIYLFPERYRLHPWLWLLLVGHAAVGQGEPKQGSKGNGENKVRDSPSPGTEFKMF